MDSPPASLEQRAEDKEEEAEAQRQRNAHLAEAEQDRLAWESEKEWLRRTDIPEPWHQRLYRSLIAGEPKPETPERRFLFQCDLGDPISCVQLGPGGACMAGSVQGRVSLLAGPADNTRRVSPFVTSAPRRAEVLADFSDGGVLGLYLDEDNVYATSCEGSRGWRRATPHSQIGSNQSFRGLDRKRESSSVKHVLQAGAWACVLLPLSSTLVHVSRKEQHSRAFKLFDFGTTAEIAPCDFDGDNLLLIDRTQMGVPAFHLVKLENNECMELVGLPDARWISILKLWGQGTDCVAYSVGSTLYLYDYQARRVRHTLHGHRCEILAIDARDPDTIASLSSDAVVKLWNVTTGACKRTVRIPGANFFLAYTYCLCMQDQRVFISCDEGAYLVELGPPSDVVSEGHQSCLC